MNSSPLLLINGAWVDTSTPWPVFNPFTGLQFAQVPLAGPPEIETALQAASHAFSQTRLTPPHQRADLLLRIASLLTTRQAEFAQTITLESGKPIVLAEAEVNRAIITFTIAADEARRPHGELLPLDAYPTGHGHFGLAQRFPIGVISAITPFNFPLNLVAHKVAPALAAGNTISVKPAPKTPLTALLLAQVLHEAGTPPGQANFIVCPNDLASLLITDPRVKMVTFTGSPDVGWPLQTLSTKKRLTLELGGNAAVIVHADALLQNAIPLIATGAFAYAGQSCISVQRVFIHQSRYAEFKSLLLKYIATTIKVGNPLDRSTIVGPMISTTALDAILDRITSALHAGARLICGGIAQGPCLEPTVIEDATATMEICTKEAFAPILTLHPYEDFDAALDAVNQSAFGLQSGIFTQDINLALRAYQRLDVGAVLINQVPTFRTENMPYGGIKDSGFGREGVRFAIEEMTELKSLIIKTT